MLFGMQANILFVFFLENIQLSIDLLENWKKKIVNDRIFSYYFFHTNSER